MNLVNNFIILKKAISYHPSTLRHIDNPPPNNGFGFAVRKGLEDFSGDAVAVYMADASDLPEDLVRFFSVLEKKKADCVFGSRFIKGSRIVDYPKLRLLMNRLSNTLIRLVFRMKYNDITNAFKLYQRNVIEDIKPLLSHHFNLTVEMPLKAIIRGYSYEVLPNSWTNRKSGKSKLGLTKMGLRYLLIVLYCLIEKYLKVSKKGRIYSLIL
ncbi:MAG: glycosyltransferase family 2 protein [Planctomycetota bacterium]